MKVINYALLSAFTIVFNSHAVEITTLIKKADESAKTTFSRMNTNWRYVENSKTATSSAPGWVVEDIVTNAGRMSMLVWDAKKEPSLSKALEDVLNVQDLGIECANAAKLARIKIICDLLGGQNFKKLVDMIRKTSSSNFEFMHKLSWVFQVKADNKADAGVYCFPFVNIQLYPQFKPHGFAANYNVIQLSNGNYLGFDPQFFSTEQTAGAVERYLFDKFIEPNDLDAAQRSMHERICKDLTLEKFQSMRNKYQATIGYYKFDMKQIKSFIETGRLA